MVAFSFNHIYKHTIEYLKRRKRIRDGKISEKASSCKKRPVLNPEALEDLSLFLLSSFSYK